MTNGDEQVVVCRPGGPDVLVPRPLTIGNPGSGQVRIKVHAIGVNFLDVWERQGLYPREVPFVPGTEGAGVIEACGPGVSRFAPGDRVAWLAVRASYATRVIAEADALVRIPERLHDEDAAAVLLQGVTAHYLAGMPGVRRGAWVLVQAGAGGVARLLIGMLRAKGAPVVATASSEEKRAIAHDAGAERVCSVEGLSGVVAAVTRGAGVALAYDGVGRDTWESSLGALRPRGTAVFFGQSSGPVPPLDLMRLASKSVFVTRPRLAHYTASRNEFLRRAEDVLSGLERARIQTRIAGTFRLEEAAAAHHAIESRARVGKILLIP